MRFWVLLVLLVITAGVKAQERILTFHSSIQIARTGELTVIETIEAQVEGQRIQRGILRDFPTDYQDRYGRRVTVPFEVVAIRRDGRPEPWSESRRPNGVSLRIGNASVLLPRGRHVWEIIYRTRFQLGFFADHDELYWNVNGNGWTFAMDRVMAEIHLPEPVAKEKLKAEAYTGPFVAQGRDYTAAIQPEGATYATSRKLAAGEGLTIVLSFPKGIVPEPTLREKLGRWVHDNKGEVAGVGGVLLLALFLFWRWWAVGRDPRSGPPFPRYEAPRGLGAAGVRYLDKMACDDRCFASAVLGLGQRGFLTIKEVSRRYRLEPTGRKVDWLPGEQPIAAMVGASGRDIGRTHDPVVQNARSQLKSALEKHFGERLFSRNSGSFFAGFLIAGLTLAVMFAYDAVLPAMIGAAIVIAALLMLAWKLLPAYTPEGRRVEDEVEGLRLYLGVAEADDLQRQKQPPRTKEEFAKFLPYAVALGLEKTWADAFAKVLGAAALAAAANEYYSASSRDHDSYSHFTDSIADMGRTISAASTPPGSSSGSSDSGGSSGGGGGGSSGGGGGGGGGDGW